MLSQVVTKQLCKYFWASEEYNMQEVASLYMSLSCLMTVHSFKCNGVLLRELHQKEN